MEREAQFKSLNSCEKTIQKLTRQLDKYRGLLDEYNEVKDMVDKMELPETTTKQVDYHGEPRYNLQMGDATVYSFREPDQERIDCVTNSWKYNRIKELGQNPYNGFANRVADLEKRLERAKNKKQSLKEIPLSLT